MDSQLLLAPGDSLVEQLEIFQKGIAGADLVFGAFLVGLPAPALGVLLVSVGLAPGGLEDQLFHDAAPDLVVDFGTLHAGEGQPEEPDQLGLALQLELADYFGDGVQVLPVEQAAGGRGLAQPLAADCPVGVDVVVEAQSERQVRLRIQQQRPREVLLQLGALRPLVDGLVQEELAPGLLFSFLGNRGGTLATYSNALMRLRCLP